MRFTKMNGAGNDFIILNNLIEDLPQGVFPTIARTLCHRHLSIGADGLMVVDAPRQGGDYRMLFYNSDGSEGEMCGNGARCICRYGFPINRPPASSPAPGLTSGTTASVSQTPASSAWTTLRKPKANSGPAPI